MSVIIYGPMACGKTRNAEKLRRFFRCARVVDGWEPGQTLPQDGLALTNVHFDPARFPHARVIAFADAIRMAEGASA